MVGLVVIEPTFVPGVIPSVTVTVVPARNVPTTEQTAVANELPAARVIGAIGPFGPALPVAANVNGNRLLPGATVFVNPPSTYLHSFKRTLSSVYVTSV